MLRHGEISGSSKPQEVRIRFDSFAARLVRERKWHASQKIKELAEGEIEFSLKLGNLTEIQRWVLSWGEHAQVIATETLRSRLAKTAKALSAAYTES